MSAVGDPPSPALEPGWAALGECPVCAGCERAPFAAYQKLRLWRCADCGLVFVDPQPREPVYELYTAQYDLAEHFAQHESRKRILFERHLASLPPAREGADRLCDVGCADGQFLALARERGWRPFGVELNPPAAEKARARGVEVYEGTLEGADAIPPNGFDVVTSWDVLEHTPTPREFALRLGRLLKPTGILHLSTLNVDSLAGRALRGRWSMVGTDHFTYWNRRSLARLLRDAGLGGAEISTYGLGRDFVRWADALSRLRGRKAGPGEGAGEEWGRPPATQTGSAGWDSGRVLLAAERAINGVLARADAGIVITAAARRG